MKVQIKVTPTTIVEVEATKQKDVFRAVASAQEVLGEKTCGLCGSTNIVHAWRTATKNVGKKVETYEYPEYHCLSVEGGKRCGARLALGTINDDSGTLFPIRKLIDSPNGMRPPSKKDKEEGKVGSYGPHRGWHRWIPTAGDEE